MPVTESPRLYFGVERDNMCKVVTVRPYLRARLSGKNHACVDTRLPDVSRTGNRVEMITSWRHTV